MGDCKAEKLYIRRAEPDDCRLLIELIAELAAFEGLASEAAADEATLRREMFDKGGAEALIAMDGEQTAGFALYFHNFSTFLGRRGVYLEDLYVRPAFRGRGIGSRLLEELKRIAREEGCGRVEWWCLDENTPAKGFYASAGAREMSEWTVWRLEGKALEPS